MQMLKLPDGIFGLVYNKRVSWVTVYRFMRDFGESTFLSQCEQTECRHDLSDQNRKSMFKVFHSGCLYGSTSSAFHKQKMPAPKSRHPKKA